MRKNWKTRRKRFSSIWTWKQDISWIGTGFLTYQSESCGSWRNCAEAWRRKRTLWRRSTQDLTSGKGPGTAGRTGKRTGKPGYPCQFTVWNGCKKNGYSQKKNQELVRRNPFLPYALILYRAGDGKAGTKMRQKHLYVFSSADCRKGKARGSPGEIHRINLYSFRESVFIFCLMKTCLDEEKLQAMIWEKRQEAGKNRRRQ